MNVEPPFSGLHVDRAAGSTGGRGVLEGAFGLLEAVRRVQEAGLTALAAESGLPKATTHRLLEQLVGLGAVERHGGRYRIGPRIFRLGHDWQPHPRLRTAAYRPARRLAQITGASVGVCVLHEGRAMVVGGVGGEVEPLVPMNPGTTYPWSTAAGKVLVAEAGPDLPVGPFPGSWQRESVEIRTRGVAFDRETVMDGICCVAVPLRDRSGRTIAALCAVVTPSHRLSRLADTTLHAGRSISAGLAAR
ncbi:helix-turn-helix domain-containing protein [Actinomadura sp. DC4]|uniref:IclR family transcriptional regulator n=1 Tax=Actinomadura sp. DC4 TaxID=3055069 RepID=UPI0025B1681B|nr:helix-turn-helix domain-containing protein [Actinomadura sp. DC4]MDN3358575.1 helix-turn-helix domain-containing protein [Actinomadura sp. DC4]